MLLDAVEFEFLDGVPFVVLGEFLDHGAGKGNQIAGGRVMFGIGQTHAVLVMSVFHAEPFGVLVHHLGEHGFVAGDMLGQGHAGIVSGLNDHALEQRFDRDFGTDLGKHARALGAPGFFTHPDRVIQFQMARGQLPENHVGGHDLGEASGFEAFIRVVLGEHASAVEIREDIRLRSDFGRRRD